MAIVVEKEIPRALLVSIKTPEVTEEDSQKSIEELQRLVTTLGLQVIGVERQKMPSTTSATAVGSGKLLELAKRTGAAPTEEDIETANIVIFDCDLRPSQLRHLETALAVEVMDRTGVIIEIFSRHAKSRLAKLQVELARLKYLAPRLRETGSSGERQQGRGSGESGLETERRAIRDRLAELKKELEQVQAQRSNHRASRSQQLSAALVGYTNAGKSSTMRALTESEVLIKDKLFATLDTTVRALKPETKPRILISDTVGFIQKLPHDLVASFRSTLDEALNASLLLFVVDASDSNFREQLAVVEEVLREVGAEDIPRILVLNKIDRLNQAEIKRLKLEFPESVQISTLNKNDVSLLREKIVTFFNGGMEEAILFAPYEQNGIVNEIRKNSKVIAEKHEEGGTWYTVRAMPNEIERIKKILGKLGNSET